MKNIAKFFALAVVILGFSANAFGQTNSETATASATIITPISIDKTADMQFGNLVVAGGGTVVLNSTATPVYSGVTAFAQPGTVTPATFDVTGSAGLLYTVGLSTLPSTVVHTDLSTTMPIGSFKCYIDASETTSGTLDFDGYQEIKVGATLTVGAAQLAGVYTSPTSFTVTVNYD